MSREKTLVKNTFIIAIGQLLPQVTALVTLPIITGCLTRNEYGEYDLISVLVSLLLPIVTLQIEQAAFRFLIDCRADDRSTNSIITNIVAFITLTSLIALVILFFCLRNFLWIHRMLICIYFLVNLFLVATQQIIRGLSYNKLYSVSAIVQSIVRMILVVLLVYWESGGLTGVLVAFSVSCLAGLVVLIVKVKLIKRIQPSLICLKQLKELLIYSGPMVPNTLSAWVLSASDRAVITFFLGLEMNAVYAVANKIPQLFSVAQGTFIFAWQENASMVLKDSDVVQYYSTIFDKIFRLLVGLMAFLIAVTPVLFEILIQGGYDEAFYQMPILFMGMFFYSLSSFIGGIYIAHKRTTSVGVTTVVAAAINLIVNIMCIEYIGIYAASISTLISYMVLLLYRMKDVQKFQQINYNNKRMVLLISLLGCMCVLCWTKFLWAYIINIVVGIIVGVSLNKGIICGAISTIKCKFYIMNRRA